MPTSLRQHTHVLIGKHIHSSRQKKRMTLEKLERMSGIPAWQIDHFEVGKNEIERAESWGWPVLRKWNYSC